MPLGEFRRQKTNVSSRDDVIKDMEHAYALLTRSPSERDSRYAIQYSGSNGHSVSPASEADPEELLTKNFTAHFREDGNTTYHTIKSESGWVKVSIVSGKDSVKYTVSGDVTRSGRLDNGGEELLGVGPGKVNIQLEKSGNSGFLIVQVDY